ncbi:MAG: type IV pilus twitching motility protein PilT [Candidatus Aureabacteria bacterium]|nr:type IV pilus twitching motility protein PilT [Candidatus Auribacterota bacterium]
MSLEMSSLLQIVVDENASDLHINVGKPPVLRVDGRLESLDVDILEPEDTENYVKSITSEENLQRIQEVGSTDFGFAFGDIARFRVAAFKQKGHYSMVLRLIPNRLLTLEEIGLPVSVKDLLFRPRGLILVTGPTGSGKTTTLASMINIINIERESHIVTVEDPIEYYHTHKKGLVTQREIGVDVPSFSEAIKRGLRQDPDVILVGEMRDLETIEAAITAAETGHLVFGTLHTTGAAKTVDRIIDAFPPSQQEQIRAQLSTSILAVISQLLLPKYNQKGRIAVFEIMISTPAIQNLIRENKTFRLTSEIQTGAKFGMKMLDAHLYELYSQGMISYADLITKAQDPESMGLKLATDIKKKK